MGKRTATIGWIVAIALVLTGIVVLFSTNAVAQSNGEASAIGAALLAYLIWLVAILVAIVATIATIRALVRRGKGARG